MFPKNSGISPQISPTLIGFSIIFTIHFGGKTPMFGNLLYKSMVDKPTVPSTGCEVMEQVKLSCKDFFNATAGGQAILFDKGNC